MPAGKHVVDVEAQFDLLWAGQHQSKAALSSPGRLHGHEGLHRDATVRQAGAPQRVEVGQKSHIPLLGRESRHPAK